MLNWSRSAAFRFVLAVAMAFGLLLSPIGIAVSHNPIVLAAAEAARHAELAAQIEDHGHAHDDGEPNEQSAGHSHGHNPTDHSHETPAPPPDLVLTNPLFERSWRAPAPTVSNPALSNRLDRPPRPLLAA